MLHVSYVICWTKERTSVLPVQINEWTGRNTVFVSALFNCSLSHCKSQCVTCFSLYFALLLLLLFTLPLYLGVSGVSADCPWLSSFLVTHDSLHFEPLNLPSPFSLSISLCGVFTSLYVIQYARGSYPSPSPFLPLLFHLRSSSKRHTAHCTLAVIRRQSEKFLPQDSVRQSTAEQSSSNPPFCLISLSLSLY